tara:strand:- start:2860 stop:3057 length:198 start_codon:yes stop_codon:yes gene_type:complete
MCNFGGSSTNTNQIIRNRDSAYNRGRLGSYSETDLLPEVDNTLTAKNKKSKRNKSKLTTSDTYQG